MGGLVSADQPRAAAQEETGLQIPIDDMQVEDEFGEADQEETGLQIQIRDASAGGGNTTAGASYTIQPRDAGGCWGRGGRVGEPPAGRKVHHDNTTRESQATDDEGHASGSMQVEEQTGPPTLGGTGEELQAHDIDLHPPLVIDLATLGQSEFDLAGTFAR
jgi:hypothetical protein